MNHDLKDWLKPCCLQDGVGDTALHDALSKPSDLIVQVLLATNKCKFELQNTKGFNSIHHAALHGDHA